LEASIQWNDTTVLNVVALAVSVALIWRFLGTGGRKMLIMMSAPGEIGHDQPGHDRAHHHG